MIRASCQTLTVCPPNPFGEPRIFTCHNKNMSFRSNNGISYLIVVITAWFEEKRQIDNNKKNENKEYTYLSENPTYGKDKR